MNRREFLKTLGRWGIFGILGYLGLKKISFDITANDTCVSDGICSRCSKANDCGHPSALSYKSSK